MNKKITYSLIALVVISVVSVGIFSTTTPQDVETAEADSYTIVTNLYHTVDLEKQRDLAQDIIKGTIVGKSHIVEYRDVDGNYLEATSDKIMVTEPWIVYELATEKSVKSKDNKHQTHYTFKVFGGEIDGNRIITATPDFKIGDNVMVLLTEAYNSKHQELVSGEFSVYKLEKGKALGQEKNLTEEQLEMKLRK